MLSSILSESAEFNFDTEGWNIFNKKTSSTFETLVETRNFVWLVQVTKTFQIWEPTLFERSGDKSYIKKSKSEQIKSSMGKRDKLIIMRGKNDKLILKHAESNGAKTQNTVVLRCRWR